MKARYFWGALVAAVFGAGIAYAQFTGQMPSVTVVTNTHTNDVVEIVPFGTGAAPQGLASMGQVSSQQTYTVAVPVTAWTITGPNPNVATMLVLNPAGTLATGTLTMPANPSDGGAFCLMDTQAQTAMTAVANTGQTIVNGSVGALTALAAGQTACYRFMGLTSTWYRYL